jgi:membrane-associated protease RseP (regulator of RpoE activity)
MRLRLLCCATVHLATACATATTQFAPAAREDVLAEEVAQRELVLREMSRTQQRLDDLAFPLLRAATPLCSGKTGPRLGISLGALREYQGSWAAAASVALKVTDTVSIVRVSASSPAERAGLKAGDRLLSVAGTPVPVGRGAIESARSELVDMRSRPVSLVVRRGDSIHTVEVTPEIVCSVGAVVTQSGDLNAYADGKNIIFPWAMMKFTTDDELRVVISHEIAHNAMGHIEARQRNALVGGLFGALADIALATQGVNTGGQYTADFMKSGATAFSQDFEREADYVGLYIMARAGVPLETGPNVWRHFAQINPQAISYASTHPTTAERFVRLRNTLQEIDRKRREGKELMPEMRGKR